MSYVPGTLLNPYTHIYKLLSKFILQDLVSFYKQVETIWDRCKRAQLYIPHIKTFRLYKHSIITRIIVT